MKVAEYSVGDSVVDQYDNIIEIIKKGVDKRYGPWLDVEFASGDVERYWDNPEHESVPQDHDVESLALFDGE